MKVSSLAGRELVVAESVMGDMRVLSDRRPQDVFRLIGDLENFLVSPDWDKTKVISSGKTGDVYLIGEGTLRALVKLDPERAIVVGIYGVDDGHSNLIHSSHEDRRASA